MEKPSKEILEKLYLEENKQREDIAKMFGKSVVTVGRWLHSYNIIKPLKKVRQSISFKNDIANSKPSKDILYDLYINQKLSLEDLGLKFKKPKTTIRSWLQRYNIKRVFSVPTREEAIEYVNKNGLNRSSFCKHFKIGKNWYSKIVKRYGLRKDISTSCSKEKLYKYYIEDNLSRTQVANIFGFSARKVSSYLKKYGIKKPYKLRVKSIQDSCLKKYGTLFSTQRNLPRESLKILNDKNSLKQVIESLYSKTFSALGKFLHISEATAASYVRKYKLEYLIEKYTSSAEQEIKDIFKDIQFKRDRSILDGQEIDLYSDKHKIGIEFNGNYWHSEKFRDFNYHYKKSYKASKKGIFVYHIFEYEWSNSKVRPLILSQLKDLFDINDSTICSKHCEIKEVSPKEALDFLNKNHIQGGIHCSVNLGMFYKGQLVYLMSFIKRREYAYELSRFCNKLGSTVKNAPNTLFKFFINKYNPKQVISFMDIAKIPSSFYEALGFRLVGTEDPQHRWTDGDNTISIPQVYSYCCIKKGWLKEGETKAIEQVMHEHNFYRIYDCGKKVWVWQS